MFSVKILADSLSYYGSERLATFELEYPRFLLPQVNTHRVFSRSSASSRAIPFLKLLKKLSNEDCYIPMEFTKNQKGMQADGAIEDQEKARLIWIKAMNLMIDCSKEINELNVHKQHVNRLLEPFLLVKTVISSTTWSNFYSLRCDEEAQPEIEFLANEMVRVYRASIPRQLAIDEWHLPYVSEQERADNDTSTLQMASSARCARISYKSHDDNSIVDIAKDKALGERLLLSRHMSPFEHVAKSHTGTSGNFTGFLQLRKTIPSENCDRWHEIE